MAPQDLLGVLDVHCQRLFEVLQFHDAEAGSGRILTDFLTRTRKTSEPLAVLMSRMIVFLLARVCDRCSCRCGRLPAAPSTAQRLSAGSAVPNTAGTCLW